jgi:UDP-N-acetylglucosamine 2-epimerase (non-hydrolysing)
VKVLVVIGTRPEAIKLAPVIGELSRRPGVVVRVCATGQHKELLDDSLACLGIVADDHLEIMTTDQTPTRVAAAVLSRLEPIIERERPDWVVAQGDTTTAAAAVLAAFYAGCKVAHVEAGLRTSDKQHPFPEEVNRRLASAVADLHFAPTARARANLLAEGIPDEWILVTGNPVIDALAWALEQEPPNSLPPPPPGTQRLVVTAHRRENHGRPLEQIRTALSRLADTHGRRLEITCPVHPNPAVAAAFRPLASVPRVTLLPALDYVSMVHLLRSADLVLTDSGGIQEECPALGVPVLVLRRTTERPESVERGTARLIGVETNRIVDEVSRALAYPARRREDVLAGAYGDGRAGARIAAALFGEPFEPFDPRPRRLSLTRALRLVISRPPSAPSRSSRSADPLETSR